MKYLLITLSLFLVISCNNEKVEDAEVQDLENFVPPTERLAWNVEYDSTTGEAFLKQRNDSLSADIETVIEATNLIYPEIRMEFNNQTADTVNVSIPNSEYLTQRMGSAGAQEYMAFATYNLCAVKGINFVKYSFKSGDHASPGLFSKDSFKDFPRK